MTAPALTGTAIDERYLRDWSGLVGGPPAELHRPLDTQAVAAIVRRCAAEGRRITVQGGMTGLAGGAVPDAGDVVINLERMNTIEEVDALEGVMRVQAGATLQAVQEAAMAAGWQFAVDLGARGSCQVGGNASTNAGGTRVLRYGTMRDAVLGVEAVLADGTVVNSLSRLVKNSSGLDPRFLFIGSEGTLGIITRLVLRLHPPTGQPAAAWVALDRFEALPLLLRALRRRLGNTLQAFEFMSGRFVALAASLTGQAAPLGSAARWHVLVEAAGAPGTSMDEALQEVLAEAMEAGGVLDAAFAASETHRAAFWRLRESIPEVIGHLKPMAPLDVSIPWSQTEPWMNEVDRPHEKALAGHHPHTGRTGADATAQTGDGPAGPAQPGTHHRLMRITNHKETGACNVEPPSVRWAHWLFLPGPALPAPRPGRRRRCAWSCLMRPAAASMPWLGWWPRAWPMS